MMVFFEPTQKHQCTIAWFTGEICLTFHISDFIGQMSKLKICFWTESDDFFKTSGKYTEKLIKGILPTVFIYTNSPLGNTTLILSRLEIFQQKQFL